MAVSCSQPRATISHNGFDAGSLNEERSGGDEKEAEDTSLCSLFCASAEPESVEGALKLCLSIHKYRIKTEHRALE